MGGWTLRTRRVKRIVKNAWSAVFNRRSEPPSGVLPLLSQFRKGLALASGLMVSTSSSDIRSPRANESILEITRVLPRPSIVHSAAKKGKASPRLLKAFAPLVQLGKAYARHPSLIPDDATSLLERGVERDERPLVYGQVAVIAQAFEEPRIEGQWRFEREQVE